MGCGSSSSAQTGSGNAPGPVRDMKEVKTQLQGKIGDKPEIELETFTNWGENIVLKNVLTCKPKTLDEVKATVKACHELVVRVRCVGATHSWAPYYADEGSLIMYMRDLKREDGEQILLIQDPDNPNAPKRVSVMTGSTTGELMDFEVSSGVNLPCNVVLTDVTLGGVVGPACHGVGREYKTVSDYIWGMRIVNSKGELVEYNKDKDGDEMMKAIQGNFGLFGVIYDITFDVLPQIIVETKNVFDTKVEQVFYDKAYLKDLLDNNHSVEIFWYPFSGMSLKETFESIIEAEIDPGEWDPKEDKCWLRVINPLEEAGKVEPPRYYKWENFQAFVDKVLFAVADKPLQLGESERLTPAFIQTQYRIVKQEFEEKLVQQLPHAIHFREYINTSFKVENMEWAISLDDNYDVIRKAVHPLFDIINKKAAKGQFPLSLLVEMRIMADSDVYLAPAIAGNKQFGGNGHTLYIELLSLHQTPGWDELCKEVSSLWMKLPGARIHWSKYWPTLPNFRKFIRDGYKANIPKFLDQLKKSDADPDGIFFNSTLEEILLGPNGHKGYKDLCRSAKV